jgi:phosphonate transport system permease protein
MISTIAPLHPARRAVVERGYATMTGARRRTSLLAFAAFALLIIVSAVQAEIDLEKFVANLTNFTSYVGRIFHLSTGQTVLADVREWFWGWRPWSRLLIETLLIAYVGTFLGAVGGFVLCFFAAANLMSAGAVRLLARRYLEVCRTVPELVYALLFVVAFGLGPLAGVIAVAIHTTGALGKLFAEVVENIDMNPVEGIAATGGTWMERIRYGVIPQVLSNFASYTLLRFEVNVRSSAVMGFVGAGGIGHELLTSIRRFQYSDVSAILVMIVATVMVIDVATERVRHRLLRAEQG